MQLYLPAVTGPHHSGVPESTAVFTGTVCTLLPANLASYVPAGVSQVPAQHAHMHINAMQVVLRAARFTCWPCLSTAAVCKSTMVLQAWYDGHRPC